MVEQELDADEFEEMFSKKERKAPEKKEKKEEPKSVPLLDQKTFNNISIMLKKLPKVSHIEQGVLNLDSTILNYEHVELLLGNMPDADTINGFKEVHKTKDLKEYSDPELYLYCIINTPEFATRIRCWMYTLQFETGLLIVGKPLETFENSVKILKESTHFKNILGIVLAVGNYLNGGTKKGQAEGFQLDILSKLEDTKDNAKGNLADFCVQKVLPKDAEFEEITTEFEVFSRSKEFSLDDMKNQVESLVNNLNDFKKKIKTVQGKVEAEDIFLKKMSSFFKKAKQECDTIEKRFEQFKTNFTSLLKYLSFKDKDIAKVDTKDFFGSMFLFNEIIKRSLDKIKREQAKKKKQPAKGLGAKISAVGSGEDAMAALVDKIKSDLKKQ